MKCEICGAEYKDTDRFCGMCGTPNPLLEVKPAPTEYRSEPDAAAEAQGVSEAYTATESNESIKTSDSGEAYSFPDPTKPSVPTEAFGGTSEASAPVPESVSEPDSDNISEPVKITDTAESPEASEVSENRETPAQHNAFDAENSGETDNTSEIDRSTESVYPASTSEPTEKTEAPEYPKQPYSESGSMPFNQSRPADPRRKPAKAQKEKRVCSLSAVVICIVIILILSVACGVLSGLYLGEKAKARRMRNGTVTAPYSYSEFFYK